MTTFEQMKAAVLHGGVTPGDWEIYGEPDVGLPPSLFACVVRQGWPSRNPLEPLSREDMTAIVAALNWLRGGGIAQVEAMREALRPFAKSGDLVVWSGSSGGFWAYLPAGGDEYGITGTHLLAARAALAATEEAK